MVKEAKGREEGKKATFAHGSRRVAVLTRTTVHANTIPQRRVRAEENQVENREVKKITCAGNVIKEKIPESGILRSAGSGRRVFVWQETGATSYTLDCKRRNTGHPVLWKPA